MNRRERKYWRVQLARKRHMSMQRALRLKALNPAIGMSVDTPCWEWNGSTTKQGYGYFYERDASGRKRKSLAHRRALEIRLGRTLDRTIGACHHCDNPRCIRPDHLFPGSNADNVADSVMKGRTFRQGECPPSKPRDYRRGELHPQAKLTKEEVASIRAAWALGDSCRALAKQFRVNRVTVQGIVTGITWGLPPVTRTASVLLSIESRRRERLRTACSAAWRRPDAQQRYQAGFRRRILGRDPITGQYLAGGGRP